MMWLQNTLIGIAGGPLLNWTGPGATGSGWVLWVVVPLLFGGCAALLTGLATRTALDRVGPFLLPIGTLLLVSWTALSLLLGLGSWLDSTYPSGVLFLSYPHTTPWSMWGQWAFDGMILLTLAVLLGFGPRSPTPRRAVFVGLMALAVDHAWRIVVHVLSGGVPFLWTGLGPLDRVQSLVWIVFGVIGVLFLAVIGNTPGANGPSRKALLVGLAIAGVLYGFEASILYGLGLLHVLGIETHVDLAMPFYAGLLGLERCGLLIAGGLAVGLGRWREPDTHTAAGTG